MSVINDKIPIRQVTPTTRSPIPTTTRSPTFPINSPTFPINSPTFPINSPTTTSATTKSQISTKSPTTTNLQNPNLQQLNGDLDYSNLIIVCVIALLNSIILFKTVKIETHPNNPSFLFYEMLKQSSLIYLVVQTFGVARLTESIPFLQDKEYIACPLIVGTIIYILNVVMGRAQVAECKSKKTTLVYGLALIPAICIVLTYFFVTSFEFTMSPFNNLLGGEKTVWSYWIAIGFLMACVIWPTVSFVYFTIQKQSCFESSDIIINIPKDESS